MSFTAALPVIAGMLPINFLVLERSSVFHAKLVGTPSSRAGRDYTCVAGQVVYTRDQLDIFYMAKCSEAVRGELFGAYHYVTQFASVHGNFRANLSRFRLAGPPLYLTCGVEDGTSHSLPDCAIARAERNHFIRDLQASGLELSVRTVFRSHEGSRLLNRHASRMGGARMGGTHMGGARMAGTRMGGARMGGARMGGASRLARKR